MMTEFDPVEYNKDEADFLLDALGKPPAVVLRALPPGVNPNAVRPILLRVQELDQLGETWCGVEKLKEALKVWRAVSTKWASDKRKGAPRFPSMYSYDGKGRAHEYGPGADTTKVSTYFDKSGKRLKFAVQLVGGETPVWAPDWVTGEEIVTANEKQGLLVNQEGKRIECGVCGHTESFNPESRTSYNAARGRMSRHLRNATEEKDAHREIHTHEFGQGRVKQ